MADYSKSELAGFRAAAKSYLREAKQDMGRFPPGGCHGVAVIGERISHALGRGLAHAQEAHDDRLLGELRKVRIKFRKQLNRAVMSCVR